MASDIEKELNEEEKEIKSEKQERIEMQMEAPARPVRWDKIAKAGLLIIVVGALFLYIGYRYGKESAEQPVTPVAIEATVVSSPAASSTATTDPTATWKTYTNDTYGFSFKYPSEWTISKDTPGNSGGVVDQLTLGNTDSEEFHLWINPAGFGMHGASDFFRTEILNGKVAINSREPSESSDIIGQVFTSPMTSSDISYVIAYDFNINNRASELDKFEKILATFQFTK